MRVREPTAMRLIATLGSAGLVSGVVLVGVYLVTKPTIDRNRAEALRAAIFKVLPGTADISALSLEEGALRRREAEGGAPPAGDVVYTGVGEGGEVVGFAIPAEGPGFMDTIKLIYGFDLRRRVVIGMEVLESRETPGLGDKIITDPAFHENFQELAVEPSVVAVRRGPKTRPNEVDCITGATISSEAVVSILNESSRRWLPLLEAAPAEEASGDAVAP